MGDMTLAGDGVAAGILDGNQLAPGIINVAADDVALVVVDADNIALQVAQIVVIRRIVQLEAAHAACVVGEVFTYLFALQHHHFGVSYPPKSFNPRIFFGSIDHSENWILNFCSNALVSGRSS